MSTNNKDYFLSLLSSSFIREIDIPIELLGNEDIDAQIIKYNWIVNINTNNTKWVTLIKNGVYRD